MSIVLLGYWFPDGERYSDHLATAQCYTNLYHCFVRRQFERDSSDSDDQWVPRVKPALERAAGLGMSICLNLGMEESGSRKTPLGRIIDAAADVWDRVVYLELADEPKWDGAQTEAAIARVERVIKRKGLASRPMGVVYSQAQIKKGAASLGAELIGVEAYGDPPEGFNDVGRDVEHMQTNLRAQLKAIRGKKKKIVVIVQGYRRNGAYRSLESLVALQYATYEVAKEDPRVFSLEIFSLGRPSGTAEYTQLIPEHKRISTALGLNRC